MVAAGVETAAQQILDTKLRIQPGLFLLYITKYSGSRITSNTTPVGNMATVSTTMARLLNAKGVILAKEFFNGECNKIAVTSFSKS